MGLTPPSSSELPPALTVLIALILNFGLLGSLGLGVPMLTAETLSWCVQGRVGDAGLTVGFVAVVRGDFDSSLVVRRARALMVGGLEKSGCGKGVSMDDEGIVWRGTSNDFDSEVERC